MIRAIHGRIQKRGCSGLSVKKYSPQRHRDRKIEEFLTNNSLLRVLCASAVQSPSLASLESLKTQKTIAAATRQKPGGIDYGRE
jgi:hypothetical protein